MAMNRPELYTFLRGFYRFLDEGHTVELKKLRKRRGHIHFDKADAWAHVCLDYRDQIIPTIIHEYIHWKYPEWEEDQVLKMENVVINRLSNRQVRNVIKRFANTL